MKNNPCPQCNGTGVVPDYQEIGQTMVALRKQKEVSANAISKVLGVSRQYVSDLERGRRHLTSKKVAAYTKAVKQLTKGK